MTIYIEQDYESHTLSDLLVEAQKVARDAWYGKIESNVIYTYRDLARADVKAGHSTPADHPMFSLAVFVDPYDLSVLTELWRRELVESITRPSALFFRKEGTE